MLIARSSRALAALCMCCLSATALAGEWEVEPSVQVGLTYDDNPALEPDSQLQGEDRATTYLLMFAEADITKSEPSSVISFSPRIRRFEYPDSEFSRLNRTDYFLRSNLSKIGELFNSAVSLSYEQQTVLSTADFGETGDGGANFEAPDEERDRWSIAPSFNWSPTRKDAFTLSGSVSDTTYSGVENSTRADTESANLSLQYQRAITPRQTLGLLATYADSESVSNSFFPLCQDGSTPDFNFPRDTAGYCPSPLPGVIIPAVDVGTDITTNNKISSVALTWGFQFTERTRVDINIGQQETTSDTLVTTGGTPIVTLDNSFDGRNNSISLTHAGERSRLELRGSRGSTVQDDGFPSENLEVTGRYIYRVTPKLSLRLEGSASDRESSNTARRDQVLFYRADVGLSWRVSRKLSVVGTFIHRNRDPDVTPLAAGIVIPEADNEVRESNAFITSVRYEF